MGDWAELICRREDKVRILRSLEMGGRKLADLHIHETTLEEIYRAISGRAPSPEMNKL
jgi:ABC-2 type transport system ATP-binding protein/Cu-processing system ATP-binding protein